MASDDTAAGREVVYTGTAGFARHLKHPDVNKTLCGKSVAATRPPANAEVTCKSCLRRANALDVMPL